MSGTLCKNILSNKLSKLVYTNASGKPASATLNVQKLSTTENACISVKVATCTTASVSNTEVSSSVRSPEQFSALAFCGSTGNYAGQMFRNSCSGIDAFDDTINGTVANTGLSATMTLPDGGGCCSFCDAGICYWPSTSQYPIHRTAYARGTNECLGLCATDYWDSNAATFTYHYPNYALPSVQTRLKEVADQNNGLTVVPITPKACNSFGKTDNCGQQLYAFYPFACICNANTAVLQSCMATGWDSTDPGICCLNMQVSSYANAVDFYNDEIHLMKTVFDSRDRVEISHYSSNCDSICVYCWAPQEARSSTNACYIGCGWIQRYHCCYCYSCGTPFLGMRFQNAIHTACQAMIVPMQGTCGADMKVCRSLLLTYNPYQTSLYNADIQTESNCKECCRQHFWSCAMSKCYHDNAQSCCSRGLVLCQGIVKWMVHDPYTRRNIAMVKGVDEENSGIYHIQPECLSMNTGSGTCENCCGTWETANEDCAGITRLAELDNSNLYTCYSTCWDTAYTQHMSTPFQVADQCWVSYVPCFNWESVQGAAFEWDGCLVKFASKDLITWTCGESSSTATLSIPTTDGSTNTTHFADFTGGTIVKSVDRFCDNSFLPGQSYIEYKVSGNQFERSGLVIGDGESVYITDDSDTTSETAVQLWGYDE